MKWYKVWTHDMSEPILIVRAGSLAEAIATAKKENPAYVDGQEYKQTVKCRYYRRQQIKERRESLTGRSYYVEITAGVCYRDPPSRAGAGATATRLNVVFDQRRTNNIARGQK